MQKTLSLNNRDFLVVKLPEGAINIQVSEVSPMMYYIIKNEVVNAVELPEGKWVILIPDCGKASEEEAAKVVEAEMRPDFDEGCGLVVAGYTNYNGNGICDTALESLSTLLEKLRLLKKENISILIKK